MEELIYITWIEDPSDPAINSKVWIEIWKHRGNPSNLRLERGTTFGFQVWQETIEHDKGQEIIRSHGKFKQNGFPDMLTACIKAMNHIKFVYGKRKT